MVFLIALTTIAAAQSRSNTPANNFQKLLKSTGLPVSIANDSLAVIPYEGAHIPSYQVLVQKIGGLYIIYTNLTEALPGKIDETKFKYLLLLNNHFDIIKIGLDEDNTAYIRADLYATTVSTPLLTRIIKQVANVTNIIGGELKAK